MYRESFKCGLWLGVKWKLLSKLNEGCVEHMKFKLFITTILLIILIGCMPSLQSTKVTATYTPTKISTQVASLTPSPSQTTILTSAVLNKCLEIKPSISPDLKANGYIVLVNEYGDGYRLLNLETREISPVAGDQNDFVLRILVSPSGNKFAYLLDSKGKSPNAKELVVSSFNGQKSIIPWQNGWIRWNWLNNNQLVIGKVDRRFGSYLAVNIQSGKIEEIPLDTIDENSVFPTVYFYTNGENQRVDTSFAELFFDPTLTRVIHFGYNADKINYDRTILRDLDTGKALADLPNILNVPDFSASEVSYPAWAPDGKSFLIEASDTAEARDLYEVSRDGEIVRLTYLTNIYKEVRIQNYSFSPDQRYIAFWLLTDLHKEYHLAILNTVTKEITDTCITSTYVLDSPFWAPNRHQFVIMTNPTESVSTTTTVLVDLDHYLAAQVAENMVPRGWLVNP